MDGLSLNVGVHVCATPRGAYHAVAAAEQTPARRLLRSLLRQEEAPVLTAEALEAWTGQRGDAAVAVLAEAQERSWVEGHEEPVRLAGGVLEDVLPSLLAPLSEDGRVLLADSQGFSLCTVGFRPGEDVELSALGAELSSLQVRRSSAVAGATASGSLAWAIVDAVGNSQVGFWPLFIGAQRFVLVVGGLPHMNHPRLTQLIWALSARYGDEPTDEAQPDDTTDTTGVREHVALTPGGTHA